MRTQKRAIGLALALALTGLVPQAASAKQPTPQPNDKQTDPKPDDAKPVDPKLAKVDDPMLDPVATPPHTLASWAEALQFINSRDADLKTAIIEVERSRGLRRQTLAQSLPQIGAQGSVTIQILRSDITTTNPITGETVTTTIPPSPTASASLSISQSILAPRAWYAIGTADKTIELSEINVEDAQRQLLGNVADAIVNVVNAEHVAELNRAQLRAALGRLNLQTRKVELGGGAKLDIVRFQQDVNGARVNLLAGDEQLLQARERLGVALGSAEAYGVPSDIKLDDIETAASKTCRAGKLEDRADIRSLYARKELSERRVTDADLLYLPTAEVSTTLTASSEQLIGDSHVAWNVMGVISIPIWDGGARYGAHRVAKAEVSQAELTIESAERSATIEISQAQRAVDVAGRGRELAIEARDLAKENERLAELAFEGGAGTSFDIVDASSRLRQAELNLAVRELELTRAKIASLLSTATCDY